MASWHVNISRTLVVTLIRAITDSFHDSRKFVAEATFFIDNQKKNVTT